MPVPSDLFSRFAAGDIDAFEAIFRQSQGEVYAWILRIVRDSSAAQELTVETFWRIYRAREHFDPTRPFGAWARRIATNIAIDHLKSLKYETSFPADVAAPGREDAVWKREVRDAITAAFRSLPARLQATATLALIEERTYEEIADALGTPVGTVKARVFRAVRLLRKKLERLGIRP